MPAQCLVSVALCQDSLRIESPGSQIPGEQGRAAPGEAGSAGLAGVRLPVETPLVLLNFQKPKAGDEVYREVCHGKTQIQTPRRGSH